MRSESEAQISFGSIIKYGLIMWVGMLFLKFVFLSWLGIFSWRAWVYFILILLLSRKVSRQFGVINILEAGFIGIIWAVIILFLDSLFGKRFIDPQVFASSGYWWSYLAMFVSVFFLHNKRHIQIRKEQHSQHH